jgi:hypothetical protein
MEEKLKKERENCNEERRLETRHVEEFLNNNTENRRNKRQE